VFFNSISAEPKKCGLFQLAGIAPTSDEIGFLSVGGGTAATADGLESFRVADKTDLSKGAGGSICCAAQRKSNWIRF
jgi:hypothetical protein